MQLWVMNSIGSISVLWKLLFWSDKKFLEHGRKLISKDEMKDLETIYSAVGLVSVWYDVLSMCRVVDSVCGLGEW